VEGQRRKDADGVEPASCRSNLLERRRNFNRLTGELSDKQLMERQREEANNNCVGGRPEAALSNAEQSKNCCLFARNQIDLCDLIDVAFEKKMRVSNGVERGTEGCEEEEEEKEEVMVSEQVNGDMQQEGLMTEEQV
jgi:hypothetical protein